MNVHPNAHALVVGKRPVCHFDGYLAVLLSPLLDKEARVGPPTVTINDAELAGQIGMGLNQDGLEKTFIGLDLALELFIFLRPHPRLFLIRDDVVEVIPRTVSAQDCPTQPSLLQSDDVMPISGAGPIHHSPPA